ncbi:MULTISPECIES: nitrite reductase large subunit NirB [unclassified Mesorhizobium]|uniref:nitrite reductase large subunit NirB n=1 Tax=unclassified Mesorhizobium TaxID=325217 RepID=UPI000FCA4B23|nr:MULTISPECIES: nitrite reductase large subunit NirB [unclassified Mesorhizobium]TIS94218.1 MAG: NAD(P)/FAD-dependent oxidoreductase [Mesorhizobium sp.]RUW56633.1 NAD(P)/FAD-dependent oxidoreductase [Mesorhizobium sp. M8A.F.Ca.ET.021.01.1.1]TGP91166.1 NAD(P)/FAD-dependent oxidoreductase [Mesorhizobium sp. M8A.F.Ca.ET.218.01.1.1]TGS45024.1 NAD(P)/FAD-dependent oxidoreductase [Mesorhizobium sp. M8A.F.Ca.ET.182.01.1.1]TGS80723.1 NAD(P)/FAD-dependent oxidoreductase [Mesorhizobium sp. M8A.F.Ca.ET.
MTEKLVIIGNGMAPGRMLEHLLEQAPGRYAVTIFNAEPRVNYDRIMLSPVLSGEKAYEEIIIHGDGWYIKHGITLYKGHKIVAIDRTAKTITSDHGVTEPYDKLVIATGSVPFIIPVPGHNLPGVLTYRDLDDVQAMMLAAQSRAKAVVIGGGLLGLEAAAGLNAQGMDVTVLHVMPTLMERQLDPAAGYLLQRAVEERGIKVITKANTQAITGNGKVEQVELADGTIIPATLVVMAVGIRPNAALAKDAGVAVNRGIVVDAGMRSNDPDIFALGECAEVGGMVYGLVAPLYEMARVAAHQLAGDETAAFVHMDTPTKLKVTGIDLFSLGDFADGDDRQEIVLRDASAGVYKRLVLKDDRIIGTVLYGETSDGAWFNDLKKKQTDISQMRDTLIFGQSYQGGTPLDPMAAVAALPDDAEICGCNGVCKGKITGAITGKGLTSLDDVRAHTKASASCGSCTGLVEKLMVLTLGDTYNPAAVQPMCSCTTFGHDEVRRLIKAKALKTIPAVMQELEWKTSCGCAKCRPALNYYLVCDWPDDYADDYQSRFINERVHANIQKDGTYSVVPRMWGGVTNAAELRAIADVVDKFEIPMVKVTGGQRIDMLGIRKEDLPAVWADLGQAGFVSGHAYAKGLRTVKTCVGSDWCRFGTQDSTGLGIRIEKFMWGSWTPAKVKMAVSGCPRNCAEATCKDVGVICVDSGYEIHFAGAAGLDIKGTEVLGLVRTEDEALEHIVALTQMYREQGRYLERIYKWAKRIGIAEVKRQIMDDGEKRRAYYERFVFSQKFAQVDPWSERVSGKDKHEFRPMASVGFAQAAE